MGFYKTEALILKARSWGEADQLLTLLSRERGKLVALAKGARRPQSRLRGGAQLFTHAFLMLHTGRTLDRITGSQALKTFNLRENLDQLACGVYWSDLLDRILPERDANPAVFDLALKALYWLEAEDDHRRLETGSLFFEWSLYRHLGFQPCIDCCVLCRAPCVLEQEKEFIFSAPAGGLVCPSCSPAAGESARLSPASLAVLRRWSAVRFSRFSRIGVSAASRREINRVIEQTWRYQLDQELPARSFLGRLADRGQYKGRELGEAIPEGSK